VSRVTWFAAGAVTGVYAILKARRTARNFTPDGIAARAAAVRAGARVFTSEVSAGMAERESELREQLAHHGPQPGALRPAVPQMIETTHQLTDTRIDGHR
jgi:uncharacterized protein DUF6167